MRALALIALFWAGAGQAESHSFADRYVALRENATSHALAELAAHNRSWRMDEAETYEVDLVAGTITWTFADGHTATAAAELIGTWYGNTFLWGWAHPSAPPGTAKAAQAVREWGEAENFSNMIEEQPVTDLDGAGTFAAIATYLGDIKGVYATEVRPGTWAYIGFGVVELSPAGQ